MRWFCILVLLVLTVGIADDNYTNNTNIPDGGFNVSNYTNDTVVVTDNTTNDVVAGDLNISFAQLTVGNDSSFNLTQTISDNVTDNQSVDLGSINFIINFLDSVFTSSKNDTNVTSYTVIANDSNGDNVTTVYYNDSFTTTITLMQPVDNIGYLLQTDGGLCDLYQHSFLYVNDNSSLVISDPIAIDSTVNNSTTLAWNVNMQMQGLDSIQNFNYPVNITYTTTWSNDRSSGFWIDTDSTGNRIAHYGSVGMVGVDQ